MIVSKDVHPSERCIAFVHGVIQRYAETILLVTYFNYLKDLYVISDNPSEEEDDGPLVLEFREWMTAGEEGDSCELPVSKIQRIVRRVYISVPIIDDGVLIQRNNADPISEVLSVEWAYRKREMQTLDSSGSAYIFEMRNLGNRLQNVEIDSNDLENLGTPISVHYYHSAAFGPALGFSQMGFHVGIIVDAHEATVRTVEVFFFWNQFNQLEKEFRQYFSRGSLRIFGHFSRTPFKWIRLVPCGYGVLCSRLCRVQHSG
jgi:hypothetical protein